MRNICALAVMGLALGCLSAGALAGDAYPTVKNDASLYLQQSAVKLSRTPGSPTKAMLDQVEAKHSSLRHDLNIYSPR
jgi:hypothetical protein